MKKKLDYKWIALSVTSVGTFMTFLDSSIVVVALPDILKALNANLVHGAWIITSYTLMLTMLLVLLGRLADLYGRVRLYNLGFAVFTVGSLLCALSKSGEQLIAARFLQGSGGALLMANSAAIITDAFPKNQLGQGLGINIMSINLGAITGYTLGGIMISAFGWQSIFLINIPVGIFGTIIGYIMLKEVRVAPKTVKFDFAGSILYCIGLAIILLALTIGDPLSARNLTILGVGLAVFVAVIIVELKQKYPTLDLSLFKIRQFAAANIASFMNSLAFASGPFLRTLYMQLVLGYSAAKTGLLLIPMEVIIFLVSPLAGKLSDKYGSRVFSSVGLALNAAALFWFSTLNRNSSYAGVFISLMLFGFGMALFFPPNSSAIMGAVAPEKRGVANGIRMTLNQTGGVLSVPLALALMTLVMPYSKLSLIVGNKQLADPNDVTTFASAINHACLILGFVVLLAIIPSLLRGPKAKVETKVL